jgi:hypothetical protein
MSQSEQAVGAVGLVRVGPLEITVTPLSQAEEMALDRALRRGAEAAAGDLFTRCKAELDALKESPADRAEFLRELARLAARKEPVSATAFFDYRCSAAGVALELFHRGKRGTPSLTLAGLEAVITEASADEVAVGLLELLRGDPAGNASTHSS